MWASLLSMNKTALKTHCKHETPVKIDTNHIHGLFETSSKVAQFIALRYVSKENNLHSSSDRLARYHHRDKNRSDEMWKRDVKRFE